MNRVWTVSLLALALVGCGGQATVSGLTSPVQNFNEGRAALDAALALPDTSNPATQLSEAVYKLNTAYSQEPTPERAIAYSVAATAKVSNEIARLFGTSLGRARDEDQKLVQKYALALAPWKTKALGLSSSYNPVEVLFSVTSAKSEPSRAYPSDPTPAQVRGALKAVENDLRRILVVLTPANLNAIEASPLLVDDPNSSNTTVLVKVGKAEGVAIRATAQAMLGLLDLVLAYDFGYTSTSFDFDQSMSAAFGTSVTAGTVITGASLLPASPFGTIHPDGVNRLEKMRTDWLGSALDTKSAADLLKARTATTTGPKWLSESIGYSTEDLDDAKGDAAEMETNLQGAGTIKLDGQSVSINIPAFTANPLGLSALLPSLTPSAVSGKYRFAPVAGSWSATFGGLFPNGVSYGTVEISTSENRFKLVEELLGSLKPASQAN